MTITLFHFLVLVLLAFLPLVYLQIFNNSTICTTETLAAKTVFDFWHESTQVCEINAQNLYKIHKKISAKQNNDKISDLLHGHVKSTLMETLFNKLIATISTKSFSIKPELEKIMNQLYDEQDASFIIKIWRQVLDESSLFMSEEHILQQLVLLTNGGLKLNLLEYLLTKYADRDKNNPKFLPLLTFGVTTVLKQIQQSKAPIGDPGIGRLISKLPEQLLTIFQSWNYNVSILNNHYNEYIFPERNNGLTAGKRFLFGFLPEKNTFRVKGKFKLQFNPKGQLAIGAPYDGVYKYLTAEEANAFICLDCPIDSAQWWQILWPNDNSRPANQQFVLIQNVATQQLLCTTRIYNKNLVFVSTLALAQHMYNSQCQWKIIKRDK